MSPHSADTSVLVATIGAEPQVISIATQLLRKRREKVRAVEVLHTAHHLEPIQSALEDLRATFANNVDWPLLQTTLIPIDDLLAPSDLLRFQATLFQSLKLWIQNGHRLRLLLAGGRKTSTMMGMVVAQLLFRSCDQVLYLSSDEALRLSRRHILEYHDRVQLHAIPIPPRAMPGDLAQVMRAQTPREAYHNLETNKREKKVRFLKSLKQTETPIVEIIASGTQSNADVARQLNLSPHTVSNRLTAIYHKLEQVWSLPLNKGIKREILRDLMNS